MARMVSLGVLVVLIVVIGFLSYEVMATFLLPLFLAAMLTVLFHPVNDWIAKRCRGRTRIAAALTTLLILLAVLLPSLALGGLAVSESSDLFRRLDRDDISRKIAMLQNRLSLGPPPAPVMGALDRIDRSLHRVEELPRSLLEAAEERSRLIEEAQKQMKIDSDLIQEKLGFGEGPAQPSDAAAVPPPQLKAAWNTWVAAWSEPKPAPSDVEAWEAAWRKSYLALDAFRNELLGGPLAAAVKRFVNLEPDQLDKLLDRARSAAGPLALGTTQYVGGLLVQLIIGLVVMLISCYYFLADGRAMLASLTLLTPLDSKHVEKLLAEFGNLTRAVVLSMFLAALAQGFLAGIGYLFVGLDSIFLLTLLTMLFALLPLVGATAVWGGCSLWLYFIDGRPGAAIGLAIYCAIVVSLADNLIKPLVLQERSNMHPLPALLSVLGGVEALGPIGVFVGPMVLALLHTLLVMLRTELANFEKRKT
ncbi:MAG: AI-2E family transporter [Planctomycetia bacterium]|nr:AI-2E family transporter [Planctomycetia bacterium]